MASRKFSAIAQSSVGPVNADFILGVRGGTEDVLFTHQQMDPHLDADQNFYVSTTGSDITGTGASSNPWATPQAAYNNIVEYELNGHNADIFISSGTYPGVNMTISNISGTISFVGNGTNNVTIQPYLAAPFWGSFNVGAQQDVALQVFIQDLTMAGTGIEAGVVIGGGAAMITFVGGVAFNNLSNSVYAFRDSSVYHSASSFSLTGNSSTAITVTDGASFEMYDNITVVGNPAYSNCFVSVDNESLFHVPGTAVVNGVATGKRFIVADGGVIRTHTNNLSYFPGNVAGDLLPGGQYDNYSGPLAPSLAFANLPPAPTAGMMYTVSNSSTTVWGNVIGGTGASTVLAFYNGTNWTVAGK